MSMALQRGKDEEQRRETPDLRIDLIGGHVLRALGKPADLLKVQVRGVGGDRFRVNVFVGKDLASGRIANSYFLTADGEGKILTSMPQIVKQY